MYIYSSLVDNANLWNIHKKYIILTLLNSNTSKWSNWQSLLFYSFFKNNFLNHGDLLSEHKDQKTNKHSRLWIAQPLVWSEINFQGLILCKKHVFIEFFEFLRQSPRNATRVILNFTDRVITLKKKPANLAINISLKIETYEGLPWEMFQESLFPGFIFCRSENSKHFLVYELHICHVINMTICC